MYGKFLKCLISQLMANIEALFIPSPLEFDRLHDDIIFCCVTLLPEVIKEVTTANSMPTYSSHCRMHELFMKLSCTRSCITVLQPFKVSNTIKKLHFKMANYINDYNWILKYQN